MGYRGESVLEDIKTIGSLIGLQLSLSLDKGFQLPSLKTRNGEVINGLLAICDYISASSQFLRCFPGFKSSLNYTNYERLLATQWLEYRTTRVTPGCNEKDLLQDLQCYLKRYVYMIGNSCTLTDVVLYLAVRPILIKLPPLEREDFIHVGRWFQQVDSLLSPRWSKTAGAKSNAVGIVFSKTPLRTGSVSH